MASQAGTATIKLLAQVANNEPVEIGTIELPLHTAVVEKAGTYAHATITAPDGETLEKAITGIFCNCANKDE